MLLFHVHIRCSTSFCNRQWLYCFCQKRRSDHHALYVPRLKIVRKYLTAKAIIRTTCPSFLLALSPIISAWLHGCTTTWCCFSIEHGLTWTSSRGHRLWPPCSCHIRHSSSLSQQLHYFSYCLQCQIHLTHGQRCAARHTSSFFAGDIILLKPHVSSNIPLSEIVPYEPNVHLPSPMHDDEDFTFLAEIVVMQLHPFSILRTFLTTSSQMHRQLLPFNFNLLDSCIPSIVIAMGLISAINIPSLIFSLSLSQRIMSDAPPRPLTLHAISPFLPTELPPLNRNVALCGELLTMMDTDPIFKLIQFDTIENDLPDAWLFSFSSRLPNL